MKNIAIYINTQSVKNKYTEKDNIFVYHIRYKYSEKTKDRSGYFVADNIYEALGFVMLEALTNLKQKVNITFYSSNPTILKDSYNKFCWVSDVGEPFNCQFAKCKDFAESFDIIKQVVDKDMPFPNILIDRGNFFEVIERKLCCE